MRFIPTNVHARLDYAIGVLLIAAPWTFGFYAAGAESLVPIAFGLGMFALGLFTDYELGAVRSIEMPTHLWIDVTAGALLLASPWLFGFAHLVAGPHVVLGLLLIVVAAATQRRPASGRTPQPAAGAADRSRT